MGTYIKAVSANTIKNAKIALQNSESFVAEGEEVRCDMQKDVRNAEANDDFKEKLMWIKSIAKREGWSARNIRFHPVKEISRTYKNEEDKEDDESDDTDTEDDESDDT